MYKFTILLYCFFVGSIQAQTFQSSQKKTPLLELYSSQGCSSCPPAERWISSQIHHPQLWQKFIPVVFHVDYWNDLGWKDPYSKKLFSQRQRNYHSQDAVSSVYTPGVIFNGEEWRGWYRGNPLPSNIETSKILSATLKNNTLNVHYPHKSPLVLNVALLGTGIKTHVQSGENSGELFTEDFVVLNFKTLTSKNGEWTVALNIQSPFKVQRYALAIWVNKINNLQPIQATGGWINP